MHPQDLLDNRGSDHSGMDRTDFDISDPLLFELVVELPGEENVHQLGVGVGEPAVI